MSESMLLQKAIGQSSRSVAISGLYTDAVPGTFPNAHAPLAARISRSVNDLRRFAGASPARERSAEEEHTRSMFSPLSEAKVDSVQRAAVEQLLLVVSDLIDEIGRALEGEPQADGALTAEDMVCGSWSSADSGGDETLGSLRSGLAPWQIKRVATYIEANLETEIPIRDLAQVVRLSLSHFNRAFRSSFGHSPHRFIMHRRLERAQGLMLTSRAPLGQIAIECGLADQSHMTRLFQRFVGVSPGTWRRARESLPA